MRYEDSVDLRRILSDGRQASEGFAPTQTGVDQNPRSIGRYERAVAGTGGGQDAEFKDWAAPSGISPSYGSAWLLCVAFAQAWDDEDPQINGFYPIGERDPPHLRGNISY